MKKVTKDMTIAEIFSEYPQKVEEIAAVLSEMGLHCVGCPSSSFETIENGFIAHGLSEKDIDDALEKINKLVK